ncbi:CyaY protein [Pseudoalteromonas ulvae UL12]|uniref:Iron-sulfur cluster assembly protein CyaY n=1 Tax=Pseudoalteromonas ulvae TaxID=107327 RepID=A0A244CKK2_PSEDV|nr:iron donor protein CyaY [Pseudoalteromonas ulvae]MBE0361914.1 CyaY protein [Pseudoalteromonas ulvae UL12]OUL55901.1 iron donor protein CyaY [Pseudoalteromonas ulvae]
MTDHEYHELVDAVMLTLEEQIEESEVDLDFESAAGILEIIFPNQTKIILNKQTPLHQIWVATKFNGHHFELRDGVWIDNRSGAEFWQFMSEASSRQADATIKWVAN